MKVHSSVNLITNSSSVTFSTADEDSVEAVKNFVNEVLKLAKSDLKCEDVLDVTLEVDDEDAIDEYEEKRTTYALVIKDKQGNNVPLGQLYESWTAFA